VGISGAEAKQKMARGILRMTAPKIRGASVGLTLRYIHISKYIVTGWRSQPLRTICPWDGSFCNSIRVIDAATLKRRKRQSSASFGTEESVARTDCRFDTTAKMRPMDCSQKRDARGRASAVDSIRSSDGNGGRRRDPRVALYLPRLGAADFVGADEARDASLVRRMLDGRDWLFPKVDGDTRAPMSPLFYWEAAAVSQIHGSVSEWSVRLPSAIAGALLVSSRSATAPLYLGPEPAARSAVSC
jgi:hypothetical protein